MQDCTVVDVTIEIDSAESARARIGQIIGEDAEVSTARIYRRDLDR